MNIQKKRKVQHLIAKGLVHYNNGRFLVGFFQFALILLIYFDKYSLSLLQQISIVAISIILTVFIGFTYEKLGFRKAYDEELSRFVIRKIREGNN